MSKAFPYVRHNGNDIHEKWADPAWVAGLAEATRREEELLRKRQAERRRKQAEILDRQRREVELRSLGFRSRRVA